VENLGIKQISTLDLAPAGDPAPKPAGRCNEVHVEWNNLTEWTNQCFVLAVSLLAVA